MDPPTDDTNSFFSSVECGDLQAAEAWIAKYPTLANKRNSDGRTPFQVAALYGYLEFAKRLLQIAEIDVQDASEGPWPEKQRSPLLLAASAGHAHMVKWLLEEAGSEYECEMDGYYSDAISVAGKENQFAVVKYLVEHQKIDPSEQDASGLTTLHYFCQHGNMGAVQWLVQNGHSDPKRERTRLFPNNQTALLQAVHHGHFDVAKWLLKYGGSSAEEADSSGHNVLLLAATRGSLEMVQWAVKELGLPVSVTDNGVRGTPLIWAARHGHLPIVKWLLEEGGSNMSEKDVTGGFAVRGAPWNIVEYLLLEGWWMWLEPAQRQEDNIMGHLMEFVVDATVPHGSNDNRAKLGWMPYDHSALGPGQWTLNTHKEFPLVFRFFCGVAAYCLGGKVPIELVGATFCFWTTHAFSPRLPFIAEKMAGRTSMEADKQ